MRKRKNVKQERIEHIAESRKIVVGGLARDRLKRGRRCGEQGGDFFGRHSGEGIGAKNS